MAESYIEITFVVPGEQVEALAERLRDVAPGGIVLEEPYLPLGPDEGVRLEAWRPSVIKVYLAADQTLAERRERLRAALTLLPFEPESHERTVRDEDWAQSWKQFFQVEHVGRRLVICPTWREYLPGQGEIVVSLDPGMAFGTGQHPTTRLCLRALEELLHPGMDVLDLGCGSGILAIAAARLGAGSALALDLDPSALAATRANARLNDVDRTVRAERGSLGGGWPLAGSAAAIADLVVANINAQTIAELAEPIVAALRPAGLFIGSGIIEERLDEPLLRLAAAGLRVDRLIADGDWRAILGATSRERTDGGLR